MSGGAQIKHRIVMFIVLRTLLAEVAGTSQTEVLATVEIWLLTLMLILKALAKINTCYYIIKMFNI